MPDTHGIQAAPEKIVVTVAGRQRVGKTALLNSMIQYCQPHGGRLIILNVDQQNTTHSLSTFFPDARVPRSDGGLMDNRAWIEAEITRIVKGDCHVVLDAGGGWTGFSSLAEEVPLHASLEAAGVRLIGLVCSGTEQADLD